MLLLIQAGGFLHADGTERRGSKIYDLLRRVVSLTPSVPPLKQFARILEDDLIREYQLIVNRPQGERLVGRGRDPSSTAGGLMRAYSTERRDSL